jgi:hypothetical protein
MLILTILGVLGVFLLWWFIGIFVLSSIDREDNRLFNWASSCPILFGYELTILFWPIVAFVFLTRKGDL